MKNLFSELKRRNVYKVAVAYAVVGWLLVQIATQTFPFFDIPNWAVRLVIILVVIGFLVAMVMAWAFDLTPEGLKRTEDVDPTVAPKKSGGRAWVYVVMAGALLSVALFFLGRYTAPRQLADSTISGKSIAVLPFENRSEDKANAFFADGIQDEILTRLAKIADLKVISRTSTQRYKSSPENLPEIAKQLGVEHVLEGSVQKAGEQVRVTVQLIRGLTDSHVWAETYDRKLTDIFAVESEIAEKIARALQAKLTPREQKAVTAKPTENAAAYEAYLRGLALWSKLITLPTDFDEMVNQFARAVELDPKFALGWAYLSVAHSFTFFEFDPTAERAVKAKEALERALSLQPNLGEAHFAQGMYYYKVLREYDHALEALQKARQSLSNRPMAVEFSSYVKRRQGKWDEALQLHTESLEIDPRNPIILSEAALTYRALRRFDEAHALIDRAREIEPEDTLLLVEKAEFLFAQGDVAAAGRLLERAPVDARNPIVALAHARFWIFTRKYPEAIHALKRVIESPEKLPDSLAVVALAYKVQLAIAETLAGSTDSGAGLERLRDELKSLRAKTHDNSSGRMLLLVSGLLRDKATVDELAAGLRPEIEKDAMSGPQIEETIAMARAHLGETDTAIAIIKELLQKPWENSLTPAFLADPIWDPLRNDPRFKELAEGK